MVYEQGGQAFTTDTEFEDAGSGGCWIHVGVELAPQAKISENVTDSTERSLRLVLRPAGTVIGNA
ncbi:MAG: hypothetical protein HC769_33015 [Cyanobacteria bacterium CRU_2_1]|nr:hypothetical protein [Cyanobacteria bacterium RU_5_0]NJR63180.1 hypothetical protein [Cyanobacteria bacterium CRU_2_1]